MGNKRISIVVSEDIVDKLSEISYQRRQSMASLGGLLLTQLLQDIVMPESRTQDNIEKSFEDEVRDFMGRCAADIKEIKSKIRDMKFTNKGKM